jgi:hypothetical protein
MKQGGKKVARRRLLGCKEKVKKGCGFFVMCENIRNNVGVRNIVGFLAHYNYYFCSPCLAFFVL